jgi:hypothetical protein
VIGWIAGELKIAGVGSRAKLGRLCVEAAVDPAERAEERSGGELVADEARQLGDCRGAGDELPRRKQRPRREAGAGRGNSAVLAQRTSALWAMPDACDHQVQIEVQSLGKCLQTARAGRRTWSFGPVAGS